MLTRRRCAQIGPERLERGFGDVTKDGVAAVPRKDPYLIDFQAEAGQVLSTSHPEGMSSEESQPGWIHQRLAATLPYSLDRLDNVSLVGDFTISGREYRRVEAGVVWRVLEPVQMVGSDVVRAADRIQSAKAWPRARYTEGQVVGLRSRQSPRYLHKLTVQAPRGSECGAGFDLAEQKC